ncbi:MAG: MFS transporter [Planctomycetes bacterium]|nr:MFS transporter [Planctomycetota bacterium]
MDPGRRNFHAVWPSLFATSMGLMAFLPMLPLYVQERFAIDDAGELLFWASIIYGAAPLSAALAGPLWGAMGDRIGKKPMAIRANLAIAVTTALMPLAPSPGWLLAMRALQGLLAGYVAPAMALVSQAAPRERHGRVIADLQVAMATGSFLGPYLGAEVSHWFGRSSLFWIASALSALSALLLHRFAREDEVPAPDPRSGFAADFGLACRRLFANGVFARLLLLVLLLRLGQNMLEPVLALFVRELGPLPVLVAHSATAALALDRTTAIAFAMLAVAQWVCTRWWGRQADRFGPLRCLALLSLGLCALQAAMAAVTSIGEFLLLRAAIAGLMAGSLTLAYAAASKRVEDRDRTLAFALVQSCIQFGLALGPQLGTLVANRGAARGPDFATAWITAAMLCGLAGLGMLWLRRRPVGGSAGAV